MKRFPICRRILVLSLLSFFMCALVILMSYRLKTPALNGTKDFVEDLSSIKIRADMLRLNLVGKDNTKGLKEPKQDVSKDQIYSVFSYSSTMKVKEPENNKIRIPGLGRKGTHYGLRRLNVKTRRRKTSSTNFKKKTSSKPKKQLVGVEMNRDDDALYLHMRRAFNETLKEIKDQKVRATLYLSFASKEGNIPLEKELKQQIKEIQRALEEVEKESNLTKSAFIRMRNMEGTLSKATRMYRDCSTMLKKLQELTLDADEKLMLQRNQTLFLTQLVGRTTPKGLHCLSMRLTTEYLTRSYQDQNPINQLNLYNPDLLHHVVFSDNILACSVVVNSTVSTTKEIDKIVFHVVTNSLNFPGMSMWFQLNPPGRATIQVTNIDNFKILFTKYGSNVIPNIDKESVIHPRYSPPLNHLRFYLPDLFPYLNKIILLDHDVVVLRDLSDLWSVDMKGKVNGAIQTCNQGEPSYIRMDKLVNFSDPWVAENFEINSCTWAYGMNMFDLREWRNHNLSVKYQRYLLMGSERRPLWKPGNLALGWVTFYNHTFPLNVNWLVFGLGHDVGVSKESIKQAAVIHYDGIMKPWLDIGIKRYKGYWTRHINFSHPYIQQCNIHG